MRGAKELDGKRVRILRDADTNRSRFKHGDEGTFKKLGTVRCLFETDDGRKLDASHMDRKDFEFVGQEKV